MSYPTNTFGPISREEMIEMFGDAMPIEAVKLMMEAPDHMTLADMRAELRAIAQRRPSGNLETINGLDFDGVCALEVENGELRERAERAESALSTARAAAFREAAEELHRFANNYPLHNTRRDAFRLLAEHFDAKAKEDTQP